MPRPPRRQQLRQRQQKVSCKAAPLWRSLLSSRSGGRAKHGRVLADLDPLGRRAPRRLQLGRRGALARRALEPFLAQPLLASPVAGAAEVAVQREGSRRHATAVRRAPGKLQLRHVREAERPRRQPDEHGCASKCKPPAPRLLAGPEIPVEPHRATPSWYAAYHARWPAPGPRIHRRAPRCASLFPAPR